MTRADKIGRNAGFFLWMDLSSWLPLKEAGNDGWQAERILNQRFVEVGVLMGRAEIYHGTKPGGFRLVFSLPKDSLEEGMRRYSASID
jgi:1-aminocyclopropane-1-carboxylate synthase